MLTYWNLLSATMTKTVESTHNDATGTVVGAAGQQTGGVAVRVLVAIRIAPCIDMSAS